MKQKMNLRQELDLTRDGGVLITEDGAEFELYGGRV